MGYVLPVNSYQSQQYANRLLNESDYSRISQLHRVNKIGDFMNHFEEAVDKKESKSNIQKEKPLAASNQQDEIVGYVYPNPVNLSGIELSKFVDKGAVINAYV